MNEILFAHNERLTRRSYDSVLFHEFQYFSDLNNNYGNIHFIFIHSAHQYAFVCWLLN